MHLSLIPLRSAADTDTIHITRLIQETQGHSVCFWCAYVGYLYKQEAWMSCNTSTKLEFCLGWLNCKAVQKKSKKLAHHLNLAKPLHCTFPCIRRYKEYVEPYFGVNAILHLERPEYEKSFDSICSQLQEINCIWRLPLKTEKLLSMSCFQYLSIRISIFPEGWPCWVSCLGCSFDYTSWCHQVEDSLFKSCQSSHTYPIIRTL